MNNLVTSASHRALPGALPTELVIRQAPERSRLKELFGIITQRLVPAAIVGGLVTVLIVAASFAWPKMYYASGSLMIQPKRENLARAVPQGGGGYQGLPDSSAIDTQVEVLRSHDLAERVVNKLHLYNDPEFNPALKGKRPVGGERKPDATELTRVADQVQGHARIRRSGLTYLVQVGFVSRSPEKAQQLANAYMDNYLQSQLETQVAEVTRANAELGAQVERMRQEAEQATTRVQQYKIANNLYSADGSTMAEQVVSALNTQIASAQAEAAEKRAKLSAALEQVQRGSGGADVTAAIGSDTIRELRKAEADKSARLAQLTADFKPEYPEVKRTQAELDEIRRQIQSELNRIMSSVKAESTASSQRAGSLLASRAQAQGGLMANNRAMVGLVGLQQKADAAKAVYEAYLNRAKELSAEGTLQQPDATISTQASRPLSAYSPKKKLFAAFGLVMGLLAGAVTILVAELWDRRLRSRTDVETSLGVPFAGVLPEVTGPRKGQTQSALIARDLIENRFSGFAESFRNLRAFLNFAGDPHSKILAITSSLPQEGKSVTSLCLARTVALSGAKVVLVDCDLRRRGTSKTVGRAKVGVVEVILGKATLDEALMQDTESGAWLLPAASGSSDHYDLFSSPEAEKFLQQLTERFDQVILDLPPVLGVADARILAAMADRVLYLVRWNKTPVRTAQSGMDVLRECGANIVGAVLSQVDVNQQSRYGYCDSSDYFKHYRQYYLPTAKS